MSIIDLTHDPCDISVLEAEATPIGQPLRKEPIVETIVSCQLTYQGNQATARRLRKGLLTYDPIRKEYYDPSDNEDSIPKAKRPGKKTKEEPTTDDPQNGV
jgi:hypothetical protein